MQTTQAFEPADAEWPFAYTAEGTALAERLEEALRPIMNDALAQGFHPRDVVVLILNSVTLISSAQILRAQSDIRKARRAALPAQPGDGVQANV